MRKLTAFVRRRLVYRPNTFFFPSFNSSNLCFVVLRFYFFFFLIVSISPFLRLSFSSQRPTISPRGWWVFYISCRLGSFSRTLCIQRRPSLRHTCVIHYSGSGGPWKETKDFIPRHTASYMFRKVGFCLHNFAATVTCQMLRLRWQNTRNRFCIVLWHIKTGSWSCASSVLISFFAISFVFLLLSYSIWPRKNYNTTNHIYVYQTRYHFLGFCPNPFFSFLSRGRWGLFID